MVRMIGRLALLVGFTIVQLLLFILIYLGWESLLYLIRLSSSGLWETLFSFGFLDEIGYLLAFAFIIIPNGILARRTAYLRSLEKKNRDNPSDD